MRQTWQSKKHSAAAVYWLFPILILLIFLVIQLTSPAEEKDQTNTNATINPEVTIWRSQQETVDTLPLEEVVVGVVSAEMPVSFEEEALKAQAVAARTYIVKRLPPPWGDGAAQHEANAYICDDYNHCQAYQDETERKEKWEENAAANEEKIRAAVSATAGEILTYEGALISPLFHSTCGGYTEAAGDYWQNDVPALQPVPCYWDMASPKYLSEVFFTKEELAKKLEVSQEELATLAITNTSHTGRVMEVSCGEKTWKGSAFRSLLGLNSTAFSWLSTKDGYLFTMQGFGHGVGLCQHGANGFAQEGATYQQILEHYYTGITITSLSDYLAKQKTSPAA